MPLDRAKAIRYGAIAGVALLVLIVLGSVVSSYNSLVDQDEAAQAQAKQVDVQYQRGFALLPRIESFAQDYLENETDLQAQIAALRSGLAGAQSGDLDDKEAFTQQMDQTLLLLTGRVENYPELKSAEIYQDLIAERRTRSTRSPSRRASTTRRRRPTTPTCANAASPSSSASSSASSAPTTSGTRTRRRRRRGRLANLRHPQRTQSTPIRSVSSVCSVDGKRA